MAPTPGDSSTAHPTFRISALSPALLYLKPQQSALAFVKAMMEGLAGGKHSESDLLNNLLVPPWHIHSSNDNGAAVSGAPSEAADSSGHSSGQSSGSPDVPALSVPVTVGVLPPALFTSSKVVFGATDPKAWLKQQQPVAVQLLPGPNRGAQVKTVLDWLEADIQEVIQMLGHVPEGTGEQSVSGNAAGGSRSSSHARKVAGEASSKEGAGAQGQQQQQKEAGQKAQGQASGADGQPAAHTSRKIVGAGGEVQQKTQHMQKHREERKLQERAPAAAAGVSAAAAVAAAPAAGVTAAAVTAPAAAAFKPPAAVPAKHAIGTPAAAPEPVIVKGHVPQQPPKEFSKLPAKQIDDASKAGHKAAAQPAPAAAVRVKAQQTNTGDKVHNQKQPTIAAGAGAGAPHKQEHKATKTRSMLQPPARQQQHGRHQQHAMEEAVGSAQQQQQQQAERDQSQQPREQKQSSKGHRKHVH